MQTLSVLGRVSGVSAIGATFLLLALWALVGNYAAYLGAICVLVAVLFSASSLPWKTFITAPWVLCCLAGVALVVIAFALQGGDSLQEGFDAFIVFLLAPVFAAGAWCLRKTKFTVTHLGWVFWAASVLAAVQCGWFRLSSTARVVPLELSPIHFADLAILCGFLGLVVLFDKGNRWRLLTLTGPMVGTFALMLAQTRGALVVGVGVGAIWVAYLMFGLRHIGAREKIWSTVAVVVGVLFACVMAGALGDTRVFSTVAETSQVLSGDQSGDASIYSRLEQYRAALLAISESPWFGHGWHDQFLVALPHMSERAQELYEVERWGYIHNEVLSFTVAAGILGALAYFALLAAPIVAVKWHGGDVRLQYVAVVFVVGVALSGATDVLFMVEVPKFFLVMTAAVLFALGTSQKRQAAKP